MILNRGNQLCFIIVLLALNLVRGQKMENWKFRSSKEVKWHSFSQPGNNFTGLVENNLIIDPFKGTTEKELEWIGKESWEFKAEFTITKENFTKKYIDLYLERVDTYAEIFINGRKVSSTSNAFRVFFLPIRTFIKIGLNEIIFKIKSPDVQAEFLYGKLATKLPGEKKVTMRKPQYHFGWDFGPKFISSGLAGKIGVVSYENFRLEEAALLTKSINENIVDADLFILLHAQHSVKQEIEFYIADSLFRFEVDVHIGRNEIRLPIRIQDIELWWPNGMGKQVLYMCKLKINEAFREWRTGFRTIKLISEQDNFGQSFYFKVNDVPMFAKGANYIPNDIFQVYSNKDLKTEELVKVAHESNFNMLRIWGGGNYESEQFYELCDQYGIVVWQDFMFACGMYPGDQAFLEEIAQEAEDQVIRLSKYACLGLWCGNNEVNEAWHRWGWQIGLLPSTQKRLWRDYQKIFNDILPQTVSQYASETSYWESSPLFGRGDTRFQSEGDAHDWGIWHDEMPFVAFESRVPRFMSEAGFQSLPNLSSIEKFVNPGEMDLYSESMLSHQKHPRGNKLIKQYIEHDFPSPSNFEELVYLSQLTQAEGMAKGILAHRRAKPYCMGTLYWQYNDCWPGISWSSIDYYGQWKAFQYYTKRLFAPTIISCQEDNNVINIIATTDELKGKKLDLNVELQKFNGEVVWSKNLETEISNSTSATILQLNRKNILENLEPENHFLVVKEKELVLTSYFFEKYKKLNLEDEDVEMRLLQVDSVSKDQYFHYELVLFSKTFVKAFAIVGIQDIKLSDNYFDLFPGVTRRIDIYSRQNNLDIDQLKYLSLNQLLNKK